MEREPLTLSEPSTSGFTGELRLSLSLPLPPAYSDWRPPISLLYDLRTGDGWLGTGWSLDVPSISRDDRFGLDLAGSEFVYSEGGGRQELVDAQNGYFRQLVEGSFLRFKQVRKGGSLAWEAQDPSGNRYYFGSSAESRIEDPGDPRRVISWLLDRIEDTHDHSATLTYTKQGNEALLSEVRYLASPLGAARHLLRFVSEDRPDLRTTYPGTWPLSATRRLARIDILTTPSLSDVRYLPARSLVFEYRQSPRTGRSLLRDVYERAGDGARDPGFQFEYHDSIPAFSFSSAAGIATGDADVTHDCTVLDSDGNGLSELICRGTSGSWARYQSAGGALQTTPLAGPPSLTKDDVGATVAPGFVDSDGGEDLMSHAEGGAWELRRSTPAGWQLAASGGGPAVRAPLGYQCANGDFDGDTDLDVACYHPEYGERCQDGKSGYFDWELFRPISRFHDELCKAVHPECTQPYGESADSHSRWDFRGMRCYLFVCWPSFQYQIEITAPCAKYSAVWSVGLSSAAALPFQEWPSGPRAGGWVPKNFGSPSPVSERCVSGDFLGNRSTQLACFTMGAGWKVAAAQGNDWKTTPWPGGPDLALPARDSVVVGYWNGDAKADLLVHDAAGWLLVLSTGEQWVTQRLSGEGPPFESSIANRCLAGSFGNETSGLLCEDGADAWALWEPAAGGWLSHRLTQGPAVALPVWQHCMPGDFTGDGSTDLLCRLADGSWQMAAFEFRAVDALAKSVGSRGGIHEYRYGSASDFANDSPLAFPVLREVRADDGFGLSETTAFEYRGGYYRRPWHEFAGFASSTITRTSFPSGAVERVETTFAQGDGTDRDAHPAYLDGSPIQRSVSIGDTAGLSPVSTKDFTYRRVNLDQPYSFYSPVAETVERFVTASSPHMRTSRFSYDEHGNVLRKEESDDSISKETHAVASTYQPNLEAWILDRPATRSWFLITDSGAQLLRESQYFYDGVSSCAEVGSTSRPTRGDLTRQVLDKLAALQPEVRLAYDTQGNPTCRRDQNGNVTLYSYDASGSLLTGIQYPVSGLAEGFEYFGLDDAGSVPLYGLLRRRQDMNHGFTDYAYDAFRRPVAVRFPDGAVRRLSYLDLGQPGRQRVRDEVPGLLVQTRYLDGFGRTFRTVKGAAEGKEVARDALFEGVGEQVARLSQPYFWPGSPTLFEETFRDGQGRVTRIRHADGTEERREYSGWFTTLWDEGGHRTVEEKDGFGRTVHEVQEAPKAGGPPLDIRYGYDLFDNLVSMSLPGGYQMRAVYDSMGHLVDQDDPDRGPWHFEYDAAGNRIFQKDPRGQETYFTYDGLNRLIQTDYGARKPPGTGDVTARYDDLSRLAQGKLAERLSKGVRESFRYDQRGRVIGESISIGRHQYDARSEYDALDRLVLRHLPDNASILYEYDGPSLVSVVYQDRVLVEYDGFDPFGSPARARFANGASQSWSFEALRHRPAGIDLRAGTGTPLMSTALAYDAEGNLVSKDLLFEGEARGRSYTYDRAHRLNSWTGTAPGGSRAQRFYEYDDRGNVLTTVGVAAPSVLATVPGAATNRLASVGGRAVSYDPSGNLVEIQRGQGEPRSRFDYDENARLLGVRRGNVTTRFLYSPAGRRLQRSVKHARRLCPLDEVTDSPFADFEVRRTALESRTARWIAAGEQLSALVTTTDNGTETFFVHGDELSSTVAITGGNGDLVQATEYLPFGDEMPCFACSLLDRRYLGQTRDESTGLYLMGVRYYEPALGRFLSPDPLLGTTGALARLNSYAYALDNPLRYVDPGGADAEDSLEDGGDDFGNEGGSGGDFGFDGGGDDFGMGEGPVIPGEFQPESKPGPSVPTVEEEALEPDWLGNFLIDSLSGLAVAAVKAITGAVSTGVEVFTVEAGIIRESKKFTPDQQALVELAKQAQRTGVTQGEATVLKEWAVEHGIPVRGPEVHPGRFWDKPHMHLGPVQHIPVKQP
ncbi:MAG: RHS repeat-associated core domain-containing protein [Acidobacteriota bacterium]